MKRNTDTYNSPLRKARKEHGISMMELARVLGVSINTIERWERGGAHPSPDNMEKIIRYFGEEIEI